MKEYDFKKMTIEESSDEEILVNALLINVSLFHRLNDEDFDCKTFDEMIDYIRINSMRYNLFVDYKYLEDMKDYYLNSKMHKPSSEQLKYLLAIYNRTCLYIERLNGDREGITELTYDAWYLSSYDDNRDSLIRRFIYAMFENTMAFLESAISLEAYCPLCGGKLTSEGTCLNFMCDYGRDYETL